MKFLHISDLHIGKRICEFSMLEDQSYILKQIIRIAEEEKPDAVLIAGDVYDKPVPSAEAVQLFDEFLTALAARNQAIFLISGNHDSPERIAFGGRLLEQCSVYLSPVYDGTVRKVTKMDAYGPVNVYLLPFVKPVTVRHALEREAGRQVEADTSESEAKKQSGTDTARPEGGKQPDAGAAQFEDKKQLEDNTEQYGGKKQLEADVAQSGDSKRMEADAADAGSGRRPEGDAADSGSSKKPDADTARAEDRNPPQAAQPPIVSYEDAVRTAVARMAVDPSQRNVLVAHQFVTGASRSDSEEVSVGGLDNVDGAIFEVFDYAALGHIHRPQKVGKETVRYCGTPLAYSFSEAGQEKSVTIAELREKGQVEVRTVPLAPLRKMRKIRGTYLEVTAREFYKNTNVEDYLHVTLTDEEDIPGALEKLRAIYPNIMQLEYDNCRTRQRRLISGLEELEQKSELEIFEEFYELQNNQPTGEQQKRYMEELIQRMKEE